jgi:SAM-dependent methyltransferase
MVPQQFVPRRSSFDAMMAKAAPGRARMPVEGKVLESESPTPNNILEIGLSFRKSKALLSAIELGLFTTLADGPLDAEALLTRLGLQGRGARDFFDALVALGLLDRDSTGRYANTPDCALYLDRRKQSYVGGHFEYINARLYESWGQLTQALRTGAPQNGQLRTGDFAALHADTTAFDIFLKGMTGGSLMPARALAANFPWQTYRTVIDIGTGQGCVPVEIARAQPHLTGGGFDLPTVEHAFTSYVNERGLGQRLTFYPGDFFKDPLPQADVLIMGRILHDWDIPNRKLLLKKAHQALPPGGALIAYDSLIDDARRVHANGLLSSLNMLIHTVGGSEYSGTQCIGWMQEVGFSQTRIEQLTTGAMGRCRN